MIIQHNITSMFTNRQLNINTRNSASSTEKLSSGYRINKAADDAAGLTISEKMRSQIRGLNQASRNIQDGISLVNVGDGALNEVHSVLQRQRELLVQAANDTNTHDDRQAIENELSAISTELDRIFEDTEFNTRKLFKGNDKIIDGPKTVLSSKTNNKEIPFPDTSFQTTVWLPKGSTPSSVETASSSSNVSTSISQSHTETLHDTDAYGHSSYDISDVTSNITTTTTHEIITKKDYTPINDAQYTSLRKPGDMIGNSGYINVSTVKGGLPLSCAMSQLGIKIDGQLTNIDLFNSSFPKTTLISGDRNTASTTYDLGDNVQLTQTITLENNNKYNINYSVYNTGSAQHEIELRLAFDVMNTQTTSVKDNTTTSFSLESDFARIGISASNVTHAMLGDISDLYGDWEGSKITDGQNVPNHTGVGYWWKGTVLASGGTTDLGQVSYGPIELLQDPFTETTTLQTKTLIEEQIDDTAIQYTLLPEYLDIQSGSLPYQNIPIRLYNLSAEKLKTRVPDEISAFAADSSLDNIDRTLNTISSIRSYYGAMTNRLEHAYNVDRNTSENVQAAESQIRDLDMENEMVNLSKDNILTQAAQAMLAQANQNPQAVLSLLQ